MQFIKEYIMLSDGTRVCMNALRPKEEWDQRGFLKEVDVSMSTPSANKYLMKHKVLEREIRVPWN